RTPESVFSVTREPPPTANALPPPSPSGGLASTSPPSPTPGRREETHWGMGRGSGGEAREQHERDGAYLPWASRMAACDSAGTWPLPLSPGLETWRAGTKMAAPPNFHCYFGHSSSYFLGTRLPPCDGSSGNGTGTRLRHGGGCTEGKQESRGREGRVQGMGGGNQEERRGRKEGADERTNEEAEEKSSVAEVSRGRLLVPGRSAGERWRSAGCAGRDFRGRNLPAPLQCVGPASPGRWRWWQGLRWVRRQREQARGRDLPGGGGGVGRERVCEGGEPGAPGAPAACCVARELGCRTRVRGGSLPAPAGGRRPPSAPLGLQLLLCCHLTPPLSTEARLAPDPHPSSGEKLLLWLRCLPPPPTAPTTVSVIKKREDSNTLVFIVNVKANKHHIKQAMKKFNDIDVTKVNTLIRTDGEKKA
ncbi:60S ribosomal protein L23a, partial [Galemys pyrenaicus]